MDDYSFWADVLTTFRSSSDLVKTVWLLMPILLTGSIIFAVLKLRRPVIQSPVVRNLPRPIFTFDTSNFGRVEIYGADISVILETLIQLNEYSPSLGHIEDAEKETLPERMP